MGTWPTQTKTQPCAQAQDKQINIKHRQHRQGCQGRALTYNNPDSTACARVYMVIFADIMLIYVFSINQLF